MDCNTPAQCLPGGSLGLGGRYAISRNKWWPTSCCSWLGDDGENIHLQILCDESTATSEPALEFQVVQDNHMNKVYRVGRAYIKVMSTSDDRRATREHTTLQAVRLRRPEAFHILTTLFHNEWNDWYFLILNEIPGRTALELWPSLTDIEKEKLAEKIAAVCDELGQWKSNEIGGVDGGHLLEYSLKPPRQSSKSFSNPVLRQNMQDLGLDVSSTAEFIFCRCDMTPGNIVVDDFDGLPTVIDWQRAGFVPRPLIRTLFISLPAMMYGDWIELISGRLAEKGYTEISQGWGQWYFRRDHQSAAVDLVRK